MVLVASTIFFICLLWITIPYFWYPLWQLAFPGKALVINKPTSFPKLSVVFAAYNERSIIEEKIRSIFASHYPQELIEVWIGSDLSDDGQDDIIRALQKEFPGLNLHINAQRSGKSATINRLVELCTGEIIVATDANIIFDENTLVELAGPIISSQATAVAGTLTYGKAMTAGTTATTERQYLSIENKIRKSESQKYGFCLGMEGGLYSMRKSAWQPIPPHTFMEDFFQTVQLIQNDHRIFYSDAALGYEDVSTSLQEEFKRKKRISIGNYQNLKRFRGLLMKKVHPFGWVFLFHKILRWTAPQAMLIGAVALAFTPFALPTFAGIGALVLLELLFYRGAGPLVYFCAMNLAMLQGYLTYLQGVSSSVWQPTKRNQNES
jgi:cellulose synthase/poly-beta-1,6-N-acetylglucosamine synthase-like glycosyltransferase